MFPLRAIRWRAILDPVAPNLPLGPLWRSIAIGMMVNNIALLRAGEFARVFALTRQVPAVSFSTGFASLIVDRVFDAVVVLLLLAISVFAAGFSATTQIRRLFVVASRVRVCGGAPRHARRAYALVFFPTTLIRLFELMARRVSPAIERRGGEMLRRFADGLSVLRSPGHFIVVFWWTLLHWLASTARILDELPRLRHRRAVVGGAVCSGRHRRFSSRFPAPPGSSASSSSARPSALGLYGISQHRLRRRGRSSFTSRHSSRSR